MTIRADLLARIDDMRETLIRDLIELVSIPTVNPPGENYDRFCAFSRDLIRAFNCDVELVHVPEEEAEQRYPWGKGYPRVSLLGRYRKSQRSHEGMHLSGHLDTVPAGKGWTKHPWKPVIEDGKLYGLGVSDMKGGIASIIGVLRAFHDLGLEISGDLTFSFTPDEESGGMAGVGWLADKGLVQARYGIITEPAQPHFVKIGHRGALWLEIETHGKTAHGSAPHRGINAFEKLVSVTRALQELSVQLRAKRTSAPTQAEEGAFPTMTIGGRVEAGVKTNVVPDAAMMTVDRRLILEESVEEAYGEIEAAIRHLQEADPQLRVSIKKTLAFRGSAVEPDSVIATTVANCHREVYGQEPQKIVSPGFDDRHYWIHQAGIPIVTYGPGLLKVAHAPDEYLFVDDLVQATKVLALATLDLVQ
ncbi:MAG TPA: M20 family metallopeptidase [Alphaproteobacteria bacterium]|nr:M20 family metallopeptidase [Alphaproteobacteria bacterium]